MNKRISKEHFARACQENESIEELCQALNISMLEAYRLERLYEIDLPPKDRSGNIRLG